MADLIADFCLDVAVELLLAPLSGERLLAQT